MTRSNPVPLRVAALALLCLALAACGGEKTSTDADHAGQEHATEGHGHGAQHGGVLVESKDHSAHFEIAHDADAGLVRLWLYDGEMEPVKAGKAPVLNVPLDAGPVQVTGESLDGATAEHEWHFSHKALTGHVHGARFRVQVGDRTYTPDLPDSHAAGGNDDHGHEHDEHAHDDHDHAHDDHDHAGAGPHHGLVKAFTDADGSAAGYVELKLHDDKGDLELWIAEDEAIATPFDLPLDARITVEFPGREVGSVTLQVRNTDRNEDEDDVANNRDGKTNYFIFPGDTGADASWLVGKDFKANVVVSFSRDGTTYSTKVFELIPHTH